VWRPASNVVKLKVPGYPSNTFVLRVEDVVSRDATIRDLALERSQEVQGLVDYQETALPTYDTLQFSHVYEGYRRYAIVTWFGFRDSELADIELQLTGRRVDLPGMQSLREQIVNGIRLDGGAGVGDAAGGPTGGGPTGGSVTPARWRPRARRWPWRRRPRAPAPTAAGWPRRARSARW